MAAKKGKIAVTVAQAVVASTMEAVRAGRSGDIVIRIMAKPGAKESRVVGALFD